MGKGSKSTTTPKPTAEENQLRPLIVKRVLDPGMVDAAQLARAMGTERLGRLNEPAPLDPRVAGILSFFMPQMAAARGVSGALLTDFVNAPSASQLGVRGYGGGPTSSFGHPVNFASVVSPEAVKGSFTEYLGDVSGTGPSPAFAGSTRTVGNRLSSDMINALLTEPTPGQHNQAVIKSMIDKFLTGKDSNALWNAIFGNTGTPPNEGS